MSQATLSADLPDIGPTVDRLLQNQDDGGAAIGRFDAPGLVTVARRFSGCIGDRSEDVVEIAVLDWPFDRAAMAVIVGRALERRRSSVGRAADS